LRSSPQLSAFLSYVVSEELAGRGAFIKAYSVAVDALGRPDSFDPSKDPVIRVMATRLRKALVAFYDEAPEDVPTKIMLVRGSYRPVFSPYEPQAQAQEQVDTTDAAPVDMASTSPEPTAALPPHKLRRFHLIIALLVVLLLAATAYIAWDILVYMSGTDNLSIFDPD